ncbi:MAG: rod shape-determining protein RodA [Phycisphaerae bacterium]|nr:rod shape-determining protein RodA [Phycisphaerae bacterium]MDW8261848.1 FtsW/RodA/SpoVE family cell cycle protein [Phycisphaerales bacterium]
MTVLTAHDRPSTTRLSPGIAGFTNWPILVAALVLSAVGILSIWADSRADGSLEGPKQLIYVCIGLMAMAAFQWIDYRRIGRFSWAIYLLAIGLIGYTLLGQVVSVPGVRGVKGAFNWIKFGSIGLQPAELAKIGFVLVLARYLRFRSNYRTLRGLLPPFALCLLPVALILKQPDLGTALIFIPTLFGMLFLAGARLSHLAAVVGLAIAVTPVLWFSGKHVITDPITRLPEVCRQCPNLPVLNHAPMFVKHYQRQRVAAMFRNDREILASTGMQQHLSLIAMGSGGLSGKGAGVVPIGRKVPEGHNDMIFALIGEQFGFFGSIVVVVAYLVIFIAGIEIASNTREPFGRLIAVGVVVMLASQTFLNLAVSTKLMPVTGVTLPLVSYGGSSLVASFMAIGLLLNVGQNRPVVIANDPFEF